MEVADKNLNGIGISDFIEGKNYFITGATGMLGKVLVEKILRTTPKVGTIFILIKANDMDHAINRFQTEIMNAVLFKCIKEIYGANYEEFMKEKIIPVAGNLCKDDLGMDLSQCTSIAQQIHVVVNCAANTNFDERYNISINTNTKGPGRLLSFAKKCDNLRVFVHVSSAFVSGEREGIIKEKAFSMGQCISWERSSSSLIPPVDIDAEFRLACDLKECLGNNNEETDRVLKHFGMERARMHGWRSVYQFTKAMGEMVINSQRGNMAVAIIRPSCIESTFAEPFPGWIQGYRMLEPLFISYGKNQLSGIFGDPHIVSDIVPSDMVVNAILAAMAKHGTVAKSEMNIYHLTSSVSNPISGREILDFVYDHFSVFPILDTEGRKLSIQRMKFLKTIHTFVSHLKEQRTRSQSSQLQIDKMTIKQFKLAILLEPYMFLRGRYDDTNTRKLIEEMSTDENKTFGFNVKNINWEYYIKHIHLPGVRRHVMKETHKVSKL